MGEALKWPPHIHILKSWQRRALEMHRRAQKAEARAEKVEADLDALRAALTPKIQRRGG